MIHHIFHNLSLFSMTSTKWHSLSSKSHSTSGTKSTHSKSYPLSSITYTTTYNQINLYYKQTYYLYYGLISKECSWSNQLSLKLVEDVYILLSISLLYYQWINNLIIWFIAGWFLIKLMPWHKIMGLLDKRLVNLLIYILILLMRKYRMYIKKRMLFIKEFRK